MNGLNKFANEGQYSRPTRTFDTIFYYLACLISLDILYCYKANRATQTPHIQKLCSLSLALSKFIVLKSALH